MIIETEKAYAAGFIDGDGCIGIYKIIRTNRPGARPRYWISISAAQKDPKVLHWLVEHWGGNVQSNQQKGNQYWQWAPSSKGAAQFLKDILPYLIVKQDRGKNALSFRLWQEHFMAHHTQSYPNVYYEQAEIYFQEARALNNRPPTKVNLDE